jgi:hypothetical protein
MLVANFTQLGAWELTYFQRLTAVKTNDYGRSSPRIYPVELPYLTHCHIFLVGATSLKAKPSWYRAGWLYQQVDGISINDSVVFEGLESSPTTAADVAQKLIPLNTMSVAIFPKLADSYRLRFVPVRWLEEVTLGIWEYRGTESDSTEDLIQAVRAKLETIEFKINQQT